MTSNKRSFIKHISSLILTLPLSQRLRASTKASAPKLEHTFSALIDTFVPADEFPGAIEANIDTLLWNKISANESYSKIISQVLDTLNALALQSHNVGFAEMTLRQRELLVLELMSQKTQQPEASRQLNDLHLKTINAFYHSGVAFKMLDYHPPSEGGYPDYNRPPKNL